MSILEPSLVPHGFAFVIGASGNSSGGGFACGEFTRGDRRLELHVRYSLGLVTYHVGGVSTSHDIYMEELGVRGQAAYPGFSSDPLDGFRHLGADLLRFAHDFTAGDAQFVRNAATRQRAIDEELTVADAARAVGDVSARAEAKLKFDARDWQGAVRILEALKYPSQMDVADRRRLEIAKRRLGAS
ncbi:MAG: hypothetical protein U0163_00150 [Gemmatimonadaceae bacterium]